MKKIYYLSLLSLIILISVTFPAKAYYWKEATGISAPFNNNYWLDVYFLPSDPNFGWVCGFNGFVIRTTDRGKTWNGARVPEADHLESVMFPSPQIGYTSGVEGIWKSTDGGASWFDVTPTLTVSLWGCYFYDDNYGMVIGEGCTDGRQRFYLTTDGGANWTKTETAMFDSGLSDVIILSKTGDAYAVSSGVLWKSTDGGSSWNVFAFSGSNVWQEEITKFNTSFLLPTAGFDCSGQGSMGGMRFTTDNGQNWNSVEISTPMFGTFLLGDNEGWACGYHKAIYKTTNAGVDWKIQNCGVHDGNLDDIWFTSKTEGWVVGEGIYFLAPDTLVIKGDSINFPDFCDPKPMKDTIWLKYKSFDDAPAEISLSNNTDNAFSIISPQPFFTLNSCDSIPVIVAFNPQLRKDYTADIRISVHAVDPAQTLVKDLPVKAMDNKNTAYPADTLVVFDSVYCNSPITKTLKWFSDSGNEFVINVLGDSDSTGLKFITQLPFKVWKSGGETEFSAALTDTGWVQNRFKLTSVPCYLDTFITVKAYGVSSIINSKTDIKLQTDCFKPIYDTIPVYNTGNFELDMPNISFVPDSGNFSIVKIINGSLTDTKLSPGDTAYLIVEYDPNKGAANSTSIKIINNDSTKIHGNKNPYFIKITGLNNFSDIISTDSVNLGRICVGKDTIAYIRIKNPGTVDADFVYDMGTILPFSLSPKTGSISPKDSVLFSVKFEPSDTGYFSQTFHYTVNPCGIDHELTLYGIGIKTFIEIDPSQISLKAPVAVNVTTDVKIKSLTSGSINVLSVNMNPGSSNWSFVFTPDLPVRLDSGQSTTLHFTFRASKEGKYEGSLCFVIDGECPDNVCIPINLNTDVRDFLSIDEKGIFGDLICKADTVLKTIRFINNGSIPDTLTNAALNPDSPPFRIISSPALNTPIMPQDTVKYLVEFAPQTEGDFMASLNIQTKDPGGKSFSIPLSGSFHKSVTTGDPAESDFGVFEHCSPFKEIPITLRNSGTLDDILNISTNGDQDVFSAAPNDTVFVAAGGSASVKVNFDPTKASRLGDFSYHVSFISRVCGTKITYDFHATIEKYELTANPNPVSLGNILIGRSGSADLKISNPNPVTITLDSASITNGKFALNIDNPWTYEENGSRGASVSFASTAFGDETGFIVLHYHSQCADSLFIPISVSTPQELYNITLRFPDTTAVPGEEISIPLTLDSPLSSEFFCDSAAFTFSFKPQIFFPINLFIIKSNGYQKIDFNYNSGVVSGNLGENDIEYALLNGGVIMKMDGVALLSKDDYTPLSIDSFDIYSIKPTDITKKNGSLKLVNYCVGEAQSIMMLPGIGDAALQTVNNALKLTFKADAAQNLNYEIFSSIGIVSNSGIIKAAAGVNEINLPFNLSSDGVYFLRLRTDFGDVRIMKFMKVE